VDILVDTNILLRITDPTHIMYSDAVNSVKALRLRGWQPCLAAQNIIEFRVVCTRPAEANGLGMSQVRANAEIARLKSLFPIKPDTHAVFEEWERLIDEYEINGKQNHDARLVCVMMVHGISSILTFNKDDFTRYKGISVLTPTDVLINTAS
jgi:predicted nucleic acid-binding protein